MMSQGAIYPVAFALGLSGAIVGGWLFLRIARAQIDSLLQMHMGALREAASEPVARNPPQIDSSVRPDLGGEILQEVQKAVASSLSGPLLEANAVLVRLTSEARAFGKHSNALQEDMQALCRAHDETIERVQLALQEQANRNAEELQRYAAQVQSLLMECTGDIRWIVSEHSKHSLPISPERLNDVAAGLPALVVPHFEEQRRLAEQMQQAAEQLLELSLQRMPQVVQQAIQVELEFQAKAQVQRDEARLLEQRRWQDERNDHWAAELNEMRRALAAWPANVLSVEATPLDAVGQSISAPGPVVPVPGTSSAPPPTMSARPPELGHVPLPRPVSESERPTLELTDAEIDALPPELPVSVPPRKRVLPAPKKPILRNL